MRWPWEKLGNDGLTNRERRRFAREWERGPGRPPTAEDVARHKQAVAEGRVPIMKMRRDGDGRFHRVGVFCPTCGKLTKTETGYVHTTRSADCKLAGG